MLGSVTTPTPTVLENSATSPTSEEATTSARGILPSGTSERPFTLERRPPSSGPNGRVERHWITRWDLRGQADHVQEILPHPCVNLVAYEGIVRVHGIPVARHVQPLRGQGAAIGTKFRPGAFAAFSRIPMPALRGAAVTLEQAFGPDGQALERRILAATPDVDAVLSAIERFLTPRIPAVDPGFDLALSVARDMLRRAPEVHVAEIARDHGVSERTLQRVFREQIGVGPKWVLRRYRLHEATEQIAAHGADDLGRLAYDLGYADHAHFSNDFHAEVGCTPTAYARACGHGRD